MPTTGGRDLLASCGITKRREGRYRMVIAAIVSDTTTIGYGLSARTADGLAARTAQPHELDA